MNNKPLFKVGTIKANTTQFKGAEGIEILFIDLGISNFNKVIDRPIKLEDYDRFYEVCHQELHPDMDYNKFLLNILDDECDLPYEKINIRNLQEIRLARKNDAERADKSYIEYISKNNLNVKVPDDFKIEL